MGVSVLIKHIKLLREKIAVKLHSNNELDAQVSNCAEDSIKATPKHGACIAHPQLPSFIHFTEVVGPTMTI